MYERARIFGLICVAVTDDGNEDYVDVTDEGGEKVKLVNVDKARMTANIIFQLQVLVSAAVALWDPD